MPRLVLSPRQSDDSMLLAHAAKNHPDWTVTRLERWRATDDLRSVQDICLYGESLFTIALADELNLALLEAPYDWLVQLPETMLKRSLSYMTLGEGRRIKETLFIKPAAEKPFKAGMMSGAALPSEDELPDHVPVFVCEIVTWEAEFRCFVLDHQVRTVSIYARGGEVVKTDDGRWPADARELEQARDFAQSVLDETAELSPPAFVIDVGIIAGRGWAVLEANPASASGIYGCDPNHCLPVIARACVPQSELTVQDNRWVQERLSWDVN